MRPVNKGKNHKIYSDYKDAKWDLIEKLGEFCSYCEMNISNQADVEHIVPKSKEPSLELEWDNFLLSCKTCNTIKNNINDDRNSYPFPDEYNTAYLYKYENGLVQVNNELSDKDKKMAENLFNLIKIDRDKNSSNRSDDRYISRLREFHKAIESLNDYLELPYQPMINQISKSPSGFHSVWLEVFKDYPEVKKSILNAVPGTAIECYDENYNPIKKIERDK